jgi:Septin
VENLASDVEQFNQLATLSNVIPIIGKSDLLTDDGIQAYKLCVLQQLQPYSRPFLFGKSIDDIIQQKIPSQDLDPSERLPSSSISTAKRPQSVEKTESLQSMGTLYPPFAVSSLQGFDTSEMDASLLMSSNYTPPLLSSELPSLVHHLFEPENISWLRHSAARKFLAWRDYQLSAAIADLASSNSSAGIGPLRRARLQRLASEAERRASTLGSLVPHRTVSAPDAPTLSGRSFSSRWNTDVHINSTALDRVPRADRARWLLEKVHEEVLHGNIAVVDSTDQHNNSGLPQLTSNSSGQESQDLSISARRPGSQRVPYSSRKNRRLKESGDLPAWARQRYSGKVIDLADPLGVCNAWEGWGRAIVWGASGGIVVGVVWVVLVRGAWGLRGFAWE